ncbi:MAG: hypothetical protein QOI83_1141 [Streptomycetaceae bacterium]|nr:hypothetical protein [Streptomycetaceae bacterium]
MHRIVILAGVAHNNPDYSPGWARFLGMAALLAGIGVVLVGLFIVKSFRRSAEPPRGGRLLGAMGALAGVFLVVGLALVALGVRLF